MQLESSTLGYLMDHIVAGRSIMPGAAMFEMAAAAGRTVADSAAGRELCLLSVAIPAPVVLHVGAQQTVECTLNWRTGAVQLQKVASGQSEHGWQRNALLSANFTRALLDRSRDNIRYRSRAFSC